MGLDSIFARRNQNHPKDRNSPASCSLPAIEVTFGVEIDRPHCLLCADLALYLISSLLQSFKVGFVDNNHQRKTLTFYTMKRFQSKDLVKLFFGSLVSAIPSRHLLPQHYSSLESAQSTTVRRSSPWYSAYYGWAHWLLPLHSHLCLKEST